MAALKKHRLLFVLLFLIVPQLIRLAFFPESGPIFALFPSIILMWLTEIIPLPATGLLIPVLAILYGISTVKTAFLPFGNQVIFLFLGSFLLAQSMQKHGWDKRMAYWILSKKWAGKNSHRIFWAITLLGWTLSMWVSNTATTAILTPVVLGIIATLKDQFQDQKLFDQFSHRVLLTTAFASSIGGMATPVGSPPNLLAIEFLRQKGIELDFFSWMQMALPVSIAMLLILQLLLGFIFPSSKQELNISDYFKGKLTELGPLTRSEIQVALCFGLAVVLWILPGALGAITPQSAPHLWVKAHFPMGVVALMTSLLLFILPTGKSNEDMNLSWEDAKKIDWGTLYLFGGGLCLGVLLKDTGFAKLVGTYLFESFQEQYIILGIVAVSASILMSEFSSNTASASIIIPLLLGSLVGNESLNILTLVFGATFGASFGFMLPVSTPPNAIVYGTGKLKLNQMIKAGVLFDLLGMIFICLFMWFLAPFLLGQVVKV
jgi:sodium-dependent dicarboxylate transporter 2/3/5